MKDDLRVPAAIVAGIAVYAVVAWKIATRRGTPPTPVEPEPVVPLADAQIEEIEAALNVKLPAGYRDFLCRERDQFDLDDTNILPWPEAIIEFTLDYRHGFSGLAQWPDRFVYLGDQGDACPYALDCNTGEIIRTDKGNLLRKPLETFKSFSQMLAKHRADALASYQART